MLTALCLFPKTCLIRTSFQYKDNSAINIKRGLEFTGANNELSQGFCKLSVEAQHTHRNVHLSLAAPGPRDGPFQSPSLIPQSLSSPRETLLWLLNSTDSFCCLGALQARCNLLCLASFAQHYFVRPNRTVECSYTLFILRAL